MFLPQLIDAVKWPECIDGPWWSIVARRLKLCPCSTGRRCHGARMAYVKINRYAVRSLRWFGGTSPVLLFRMCCVSTAYQWRMGDAHAAHMAYEWRCHCVWCRVWEPDHCVSTAQVAYAQRTSHVRAAIKAVLWCMVGVCTAHGLRICLTCKYTSYMCVLNVTFKCPVENICIYMSISLDNRENDRLAIIPKNMICSI